MKKIVNDFTARPVADSPLSYDEALDHSGLMHLSETFNTRLQNYYKTEFNLPNRLRKLKQTKANLKEFVKKNTLSACGIYYRTSGDRRNDHRNPPT